MKNRIWLFHLPLVALFSFAFYVTEMGVEGELQNPFLRGKFFPFLRQVEGLFTNAKFHLRGPQAPKNRIVIVDIDNAALSTPRLGRWPWHRDITAELIDRTFQAGARFAALDIVFSEPDTRVPPNLAEELKKNKLAALINQFETDYALAGAIAKHRDRLVLGWTWDLECQPAYASAEECPLGMQEVKDSYPRNYDKFAYDRMVAPHGFHQETSPMISAVVALPNLDMYNDVAAHAGYFNAWPDIDGYIRRTNLAVVMNGKLYPSLPLALARIVLNETLVAEIDDRDRIASLKFGKSGRAIPITPLGAMEINFRGPGFTFEYVSAADLMNDESPTIAITKVQGPDRRIASVPRDGVLKDAIAFIGISALGVHDMRAFPFESNTPGVEGHATILDNLLAGDMMKHGSETWARAVMFLLMTAGALAFAYFTGRLESVPALVLFIFVMSGMGIADLKLLFANNSNWNTGFLYLEFFAVFGFTLAVKYVMEERNKKFIRGAFSKYVAPAIVDSILKDPTKLTVGGEKRELTILFSDIRGFTTFSETLDAKRLAQFLNDYLGIMTDIVFENEGTLDKYIGDAVMAFWGAPLDQPKHALNACRAAAKMQQALSQHRQRFKDTYGVDVNIGIGINSGPVSVGNMGSDRIFEYTVIGDHVNLASRLEGLTKYYGAGIVTTRFTFDDIAKTGETPPPHRVLDFVKVKGKKNAVELIQVLERDLPAEGLRLFTEGRELYGKRQWDDAIRAFEKANELIREAPERPDGPCEMYVERCKEFKLNPPAADWDGSWEMHSK